MSTKPPTPSAHTVGPKIITAADCTQCGKMDDVKKMKLVTPDILLCAECQNAALTVKAEGQTPTVGGLCTMCGGLKSRMNEANPDCCEECISNLPF